MIGRITVVEEIYLGSVLASSLAGGETTIIVEDASDFDASGRLVIDPNGDEDGPEILYWTAVDDDTGYLILSAAVVGVYTEGAAVNLYPLSVERWAYIISGDSGENEEGVAARVPHALFDRIPVGIRDLDAGEGETVSADFISDELVIKDVTGQAPVVDGSFIDSTTFEVPPTDGIPPASSPAPTVQGGVGFLAVKWTAVSNSDRVTYDVHISTSSGFTPDDMTTKSGEVSGTIFFINKLPSGADLAYGTTYYVKLVARDDDGEASASSEGSGQMVKVVTVDLTDALITNAKLLDDAVTAIKIAADAVTSIKIIDDAVVAAKIAANAVTTAKLDANAVTTAKIAADAVTAGELAANAVDSAALQALAVTTAKLDANAVTTAKIAADAVTAGELAADAVDTAALQALAVTTAKLDANAVTTAKIAADAVTAGELAALSVDTAALQALAVTTAKLDAAAVTTAKIAADAVTAAELAANSVDTAAIQAAAVTGTSIAANTITAANITAGTITATEIAAATITGAKIAAATIAAGNIISATITTTQIAAATITGSNIAAGTITATNITAGTITATEIAAATITGAKIAATTIAAGNIIAGTITTTQIAASTITGSNIAATTITAANITAGTITTTQIAAATITGSNIAATTIAAGNIISGTITATQIAASTITGSKIAAGTITASNITAGTITATEIAAATITGAKIAATTITAGNIVAGTITATEIAASTITGSKIAAGTITASNITAGTITATEIAASTITGAKIAATTITAANIAASTITTTQIASLTIVAGNIAAGTITAAKIAADTITGNEIAANAISASEIAADAVTASKILAGNVTAAKLETSLVLTTKLVAGTDGASRIELGTLDAAVGLYAYAPDGTTNTFSVDAGSGNVYIAGRLDFGSSRLDSDVIELDELPSAGYQTPLLVQSTGGYKTGGSTVSATWSAPTTAANLLLMIVGVSDADGTAAAPSLPSGWTLITSKLNNAGGSYGQALYVYRAGGTARSGTETITLNDTGLNATMQLMEYSGVLAAAADQTATSSGTSSPTTVSGTTGTTTQTDEIWVAVEMHESAALNVGMIGATNSFSLVRSTTVFGHECCVLTKNVTATGTADTTMTLDTSGIKYCGIMMTFKAKTAQQEAPAADKLRIYALDDAHSSSDCATLLMQNELGIEKNLEFPGMTKFRDVTAPSFFYAHSDFCEVSLGTADQGAAGEGLVARYIGTGTGVTGQQVTSGAHPGVARVFTGSTNTGLSQLMSGHHNHDIGAGRMRMGALVRVPTASDATDTFFCGTGFKNFNGLWNNVLTGGNAVVVRYSHGTNSGKWQAAVSDGSASTTADCGVTATANQWYWIEIDIAADGSEVKFYIDGVLRATISTNLPTGPMGHQPVGIVKTVGTTSRNFDCDFYYVYIEGGARSSS